MKQTERLRTLFFIAILCACAALWTSSCKRPPKKPPAPPADNSDAADQPELASPDDVAICVWDDASLVELDQPWPLPYDWQALLFRNLHAAGAVVIAPLFSLDSPGADPEGGERLAGVIGALAHAAAPSRVVIPAQPQAAILHHWPPLALRNDDVLAVWASMFPALPEGEEPVRYGPLLPANPQDQDNLSVEAAAAAAFLGLDPRLLREQWGKLAARNEPFPELPLGGKRIPAALTGDFYVFGLRPYQSRDGFPEFSCRDALLMNLDPSPAAAAIPEGASRPPNADTIYWLRDVQTGAYPPRALGAFTLGGIVPTTAFTIYEKDRPAQLVIGGINREDKSGAAIMFPLDNPEAETLDGTLRKLDYIPLAMSMNRDRKTATVLDGRKRAVLTVDASTLREVKAYPLKDEFKLLADPGPYAAEARGVPAFPIQMAMSPATDTAYMLVPYTDSLLRFDPHATPSVSLKKLPEKAFHMELTDDAQYIYLLGGEGRVLSGLTASLAFSKMAFPDAGVSWSAPAAFHFKAMAGPSAESARQAKATPAPAGKAPADYRTLFTIDAKSKQVFTIDSAGLTKPLRLYASPAQIKHDLAKTADVAIEPVSLIHTLEDSRLFVLLRVVRDSTGKLPPHYLGIIDPYSRNWLTSVTPVNLSGMIVPFVAEDLIVFIASGPDGVKGVAIDTGATLRGLRRDMAAALKGKAVLVARNYGGKALRRPIAGVDSANPWPPHQISANIIQNIINGEFAPVR